MSNRKRILSLILSIVLFFGTLSASVYSTDREGDEGQIDLSEVKSALLMDAGSGTVLYEYNADLRLPPASITKIMTLLLVMEEVDGGRLRLDEKIAASPTAAHMGGSQIYLEPGEELTAEELIKSVVVASANDAAAALAERVGGTLENFVSQMNTRAKQLGMKNTHFENTNGLDDTTTDHLTTAMDIALMSRELIKHRKILEYTTIWMDTVRNGAFGLTNTNKLIRFYKGANGLKTGSTSKAGFCISATAERGGLCLIAVIMGAPTSSARNAAASKLLDYGFASYENYRFPGDTAVIPVTGGKSVTVEAGAGEFDLLLKKGQTPKITLSKELPESLGAPVKEGERVGELKLSLEGKELAQIPYVALQNVERLSFFDVVLKLLGACALF